MIKATHKISVQIDFEMYHYKYSDYIMIPYKMKMSGWKEIISIKFFHTSSEALVMWDSCSSVIYKDCDSDSDNDVINVSLLQLICFDYLFVLFLYDMRKKKWKTAAIIIRWGDNAQLVTKWEL